MGKVISNIGLLDLTAATEESISSIDKILNVGMLIYSTKTAGLVSKLNISDLGTSMEVPEGYQLSQGRIEMDSNYFKNIKEPVSILAMGQVIMKNDVCDEDIENGIKDMHIAGQLMCPERLLKVIQSKCSKVMGQILTYAGDYSLKIGKTNINNQFLKNLEKPVSLALIGKSTFIDDIDKSLFDEKIENINVIGKVVIKEEYLDSFNKKARDLGQCKVEVIPEGYIYIGDDLHIDAISIKRFDHAKVYISGMLDFGCDITPELLKNHIEKITVRDAVVCRKELKEDVYGLCDDMAVHICDYSGKLVIADGERRLTQSELKYTQGPITYIVRGELTVSSDISPETFLEKVENIDNFGEILCDAERCGLVQIKLRVSSGEVMELGAQGDSNIGYLKL